METFALEKHMVDLCGCRFEGSVLDVGGGGEGVIARHTGQRVVVIDNRRDELMESPNIGLKIVMDACKMGFMDNCFENVTCFFSLMFMREAELPLVLNEIYRVMKPGGRLWIWDVVMMPEPAAEVFLVPLQVKISGEMTVTTTYGIGWHRGQSAESMISLCSRAGFALEGRRDNGSIFALHFIKH